MRDSLRLSPNLLLAFKSSNTSIVASSIDVNGAGPRPALTDARTNITVVLDPQTFLPSRIRAFENHQILGPSTSDFRLYNYTRIDGINFPRNMKLLYNNDLMLTEMHVDSITVNPKFDSGFFAGLPLSEVNSTILALPPTVPQRSEIYNSAEVFDAV